MTHSSLSRRQALKTMAAVMPVPAITAGAGPASAASNSLTIGIATQGFRTYTNRQLAEELAREGIHVVQLFLTQTDSNYWRYGKRADVSDLTPSRCKAIAEDYRSSGIAIHSIGVYANMIHPDPAERQANLDYFEAMMQVGDAMGVHAFITEAGHYYTEGPAPRVPHDFQEDVWYTMIETGKKLGKIADRYGATVLFEPFFRSLLAGAKRTRLFLEEIGSPRIRALLDPANLLELNDLHEMFNQLGNWIDCLHAKDRKLHVDKGVGAGQGDLDYREFVTLAAKYTPDAPLILEYVGPDDYKQAYAHLQNAMNLEGITRQQ